MQEHPLFIQKQADKPKTKNNRQKPSILTTFRYLHQNETEKNQKKKKSSTKTETKSEKEFQGEGKMYQKFVASRIPCNTESGEAVGEWSLFSLSSSGSSLRRAFGVLGFVSSDPEVPIEVSS
jgi:hypothetical protein